ncbi:MAG TPA: hypothetical protein VF240_07070 [Pyrinomonadaceae bacterium]
MLKKLVLVAFACLAAWPLLVSESKTPPSPAPEPPPAATAFAFPDARDNPPASWTGPVFRLSQNYPTTMPSPETYPWKAIDFKTKPMEYLRAVLAYCLEGNITSSGDFDINQNTTRKWYHAPWMHPNREFIHGMTNERHSRPGELHPLQTSPWLNWAVGMYNAPGGYVIGRVWANPTSPDPSLARFPDGTVGFKLLFTQAPATQVPYLANSFEWLTDINQVSKTGKPPVQMRLLQIDVAVRDTRANSTTGWVFGTFTYDAQEPGSTPWQRLVPIGLMWGNDPTRLFNGQPLTQTKINPDLRMQQHLGYGVGGHKRLNGPVDNPVSSCLSCHSTAAVSLNPPRPTISGVTPPNPTNQQIRTYFRNISSGTPFSPGYTSLDYSLQLQVGIALFVRSGGFQPPGPTPPGPMTATTMASSARRSAAAGAMIKPMERDGTPPPTTTRARRPRRRRAR